MQNNALDVPDLSVLLQCLGFNVESQEKVFEIDHGPSTSEQPVSNALRIEMSCAKSGMRTTLIKTVTNCKCPSEEEASKGEFWNVSGCGPSKVSFLLTYYKQQTIEA